MQRTGIIKQSKQPHTFIYLSGLNSSTISSLIDFMYNGEVSVVQEDLDGFLSAANRLKIKGLSQALETSENLKESFNQEHKLENAEMETVVDDLFVTENCEDQNIEENFDTTVTVPKESSGFRFESNLGNTGEKLDCPVCGKTFLNRGQLNGHKDNNHAEDGVFHPCSICDKSFRTKNARNVHKFRNHKSKLE